MKPQIINVTSTWKYKIKRVFKYILVLFIIMIACSFTDAFIAHFIDDPWLRFKDDWKWIYGAMAYRLLSTWNYE